MINNTLAKVTTSLASNDKSLWSQVSGHGCLGSLGMDGDVCFKA